MTAEAGSERERVARRRLTRKEAQAETRRRVLDAAAEVFGERGFRAASLSDVADRAGYTIGAVYSNFASKDALFHELMEGRLRQVEAALAADGTAGERTKATIDERIEAELDRLQAAEDAVPAGWWRLLAEFRAVAAADPDTWADLADSERRCREIMARRIRVVRGRHRRQPAIDAHRARRAHVRAGGWPAMGIRRGSELDQLGRGASRGRGSDDRGRATVS